jgi:O6-methylguanine-DNA--protein-cysteine methyltransferase
VRAIHPFALMPRFDAFDRLSSALPARPRLGYEPGPLPDGRQPSLWALPFLTFEAYASPGGAARVEEAHRWLTMVGKVGNMLLLQPNSQADAVLTELKEQIAKSLAQADAGTDAATLQGEAEVVSFWQAVNAHETGEHAQAAQLLKKYLDGYPQGRWRAIGAAMMADSLAQAGEPDAAQAAWREVPPGRRLYGAMRAAGLLPLAEPAAQ